MSERPILMSAPMVLAILAGTKTETRRPVRVPRGWEEVDHLEITYDHRGTLAHPGHGAACVVCPYGVPGDRLWVRERTRVLDTRSDTTGEPGDRMVSIRYEVDGETRVVRHPARLRTVQPGQCMPNGASREAARIMLHIEEVRVERLRAIDEAGAIAEGVDPSTAEMASRAYGGPHRWAFARLWGSIYGHRPGLAWADDPWVWVVRYSVLDTMGGL